MMSTLKDQDLLSIYGGGAYNTGVPKYVLIAIFNFFCSFFK